MSCITKTMNTNNTSKIAPEGQGRSIRFLSPAYTPVYYGFNCRPRQVKYYKVEDSTERVLEGGYDRQGITDFIGKVNNGYLKSRSTCDGYRLEIQSLDCAIRDSQSQLVRDSLRKQRNALETKFLNLNYKVNALKDCIDKMTALLNSEGA